MLLSECISYIISAINKFIGTSLVITSVVMWFCMFVVQARAESPDGGKLQPEASRIEAVLDRLQEKMSGIQGLQTGFVQEKELAVFKQKIVLKGKVALRKPSMLAWHVLEPMRYSLVMDGDMVRQWDEDSKQVQEISLARNPAFQAAVAQMKQWFSGTYKSLEKDYTVGMPSQSPVTLEFTPREATVAAKVIKRVTVIFKDDERYIQQIRVEEQNGDGMSLTFVDTRLNEPIDEAVWEVKPRV